MMLRQLEDLAEVSIGRGCGFASIPVLMTMVAHYGNIAQATKVGGVLTLATCLVLVVRGMRAPHHPYKRTEVWLMLRPAERPRPELAQRVIGSVLRETYLRFALYTGQASVMMLTISLVFGLVTGR